MRNACAWVAAAGLLVGSASSASAQEAAAVRQEIDQLRRDFETLKQQYGDRLTALESKLAAVEGAAPAAGQPPPAPPAAAQPPATQPPATPPAAEVPSGAVWAREPVIEKPNRLPSRPAYISSDFKRDITSSSNGISMRDWLRRGYVRVHAECVSCITWEQHGKMNAS